MINLGTVNTIQPRAVQEAREKVRQAIEILSGDAPLASRIAGVTSQLARRTQRIAHGGNIVVHLDPSGPVVYFVMDFVGLGEEEDSFLIASFFDRTSRILVDGDPAVRVGIGLPSMKPEMLSDRQLAHVRDLIQQKGRDALMEELQATNQELQESFDRLQRTRSAKEQMETELNVGRDIQMSMLPVEFPPFPHRNELAIFASLHPARQVGGDFYDFFFIDENRFCFCVGDVSGKGVPAALFMAVTKTLIKSRASNDFSPASIVTHVNDELSTNNDSAMFVTLWLGILDVHTGALTYTNAGHNPPYLKKTDGDLIRMAELHGPVVGAVEELVYGEHSIDLEPEDLVFLYTDGVTEAMDPDGSLYEEDRLVKVLRQEFGSVEEIVAASADDVWRFQADAEQADDVTVLALTFCGEPERQGGASVLRVTVQNRLEEIDRVNLTFESFSAEHGLPDKLRRSMKLIFDDLLNNVITYAFDDNVEHRIDIDIELTSSRLTVSISDDGRSFDPFDEAPAETELDLEERELGGLGIHLVKNLMDEVSYTRKNERNVVVLTKLLEP